MHVGYKLIDNQTNAVIDEWGGVWGQSPGIPNPLELPNGDVVCGAKTYEDYSGYTLIPWEMDDDARPKRTKFDGADFLARVTDEEYAAITGSNNIKVRRWLDTFRLRGEIDVSGVTAKAAKAGLVALGLLTRERADEIFAEE